MFTKFNAATDVSKVTLLKKSIAKKVSNDLVENFPLLEEVVEELVPKKAELEGVRLPDNVELLAVDKEIRFFRWSERDAETGEIDHYPYVPTMRILLKYPNILPRFQMDAGAIKFVLKNQSDVMAPGLTNEQAHMDEVDENTPVALFAHGKEHPFGIGLTIMSSAEIKEKNAGVAVKLLHVLNDGLWKMKGI
ncbi:Translation-associated RNA-binding hypothetical protein [Carpediemonas membranifera]|uniref:PUA domain-containing protein n=1 Tax=Carpediemonas membranifera TaxID=201153 RepID=A0A8J6B9K3_9EUKA|nr:Translation-associated RNA-binding hypothetical protein [Carpediemonas membranifera]|eukprot:KAG9396044.1 Translation-associated RNA-binding hypothetical protein [Carpediemonas membranifera]